MRVLRSYWIKQKIENEKNDFNNIFTTHSSLSKYLFFASTHEKRTRCKERNTKKIRWTCCTILMGSLTLAAASFFSLLHKIADVISTYKWKQRLYQEKKVTTSQQMSGGPAIYNAMEKKMESVLLRHKNLFSSCRLAFLGCSEQTDEEGNKFVQGCTLDASKWLSSVCCYQSIIFTRI